MTYLFGARNPAGIRHFSAPYWERIPTKRAVMLSKDDHIQRSKGMLTLRQGSQALSLLQLLSVAGEFPLRSLQLLGNERVLRNLIRRLTLLQHIRSPDRNRQWETRLLRISGSGREKSIRLCKSSLMVLECICPDLYRYYMDSFWNHHFPGDTAHRERNHRVAEAVAFCWRAGIEIFPCRMMKLQLDAIRPVMPHEPVFYPARDLKKIRPSEQNKTAFTRMVGTLFYPGGCYAVYNSRDAAMKWNGMGEFKALHSLTEIARMNAGLQTVDSALLLGRSWKTALDTLQSAGQSSRPELRFDGIYRHIYFLPLNESGMRRLKLLILPNWREQLLNLLFEAETRSYDRGFMEYDACVDGACVYSHLDGDLARLIRFREAMELQSVPVEVLCFPDQVPLLQNYLGSGISLKIMEMELVERELGLAEGIEN